jgi:biopolymer transport protein ExbB/TolQ
MNGIAQAILAATPLAGLVLYFALSGQQEVKVDQKRYEVNHEIQQGEFDLEFVKIFQALADQDASEEERAKGMKKVSDMELEIAALKEEEKHFETVYDAQYKNKEKELEQLRSALDLDKEGVQ